jgi:hypothetical protein
LVTTSDASFSYFDISLYRTEVGRVIGMVMGPVLIVIFMACYRAGIFDGINGRKRLKKKRVYLY